MLALTGCGDRNAATDTGRTEMAGAPAPVGTAHDGARRSKAVPDTPVSVALPQIAYVYDYTLELPVESVTPLFERHRRACEAAGPARCQVLGAETEAVGRTDTRATLSLRAEAAWLVGFRGRLEADANTAEGRIAGSKTSSEDLGRQVSDTAARVRALITLQGRLEQLLARRNGKLADLLEIERELAASSTRRVRLWPICAGG